MPRIITDGPNDWIVVADWFGAERAVFRGTLFGCIDFLIEIGE
jgi:hypothetical protein